MRVYEPSQVQSWTCRGARPRSVPATGQPVQLYRGRWLWFGRPPLVATARQEVVQRPHRCCGVSGPPRHLNSRRIDEHASTGVGRRRVLDGRQARRARRARGGSPQRRPRAQRPQAADGSHPQAGQARPAADGQQCFQIWILSLQIVHSRVQTLGPCLVRVIPLVIGQSPPV